MNTLTSTKIIVENEELEFREWNFEKDHENVSALLEIVFEKELESKGLSVKNIFNEYKSMLPFLKFLGIFNKNFKHSLDGYVIENEEGNIISSVNIGYAMGNQYEVAMVATHPDYRRRGLARKLVTKAVNHAKNLGAKMCVLEVLDINEPAYKLYRSLGFVHYDSITRQKLDPEKLATIESIEIPNKYHLKEMKRGKKTNQARFDLDKRVTPEKVQRFKPIERSKYHKSLIIKIIRPLAKLVLRIKPSRWTIHYDNKLVGTIYVDVSRKEGTPHRVELMIDPEHTEKLAEPMLTYALELTEKNLTTEQNIIVELRISEENQIAICKKYGFVEVEAMHLLGLKFE